MRKALLFFKHTCKNCLPAKDFLEGLREEPMYAIVETYDMDTPEGLSMATYHGVILSPTVLVTDANDDDEVFGRYVGEIGKTLQEKIIKELQVGDEG